VAEYQIVPATREHAVKLAARMRASDLRELRALGLDPFVALYDGIKVSRDAVTGLVDGRVLGMFGVAVYVPLSDEGCPWFLGSYEVPQHSRAFLRFCKTGLSHIAPQYSLLVNYVDARYPEAVRWVRWLGFTVDAPEPRGPHGVLFHRFWRVRA